MKNLTVLDGGMGRELKRIGAPFSQPLWSAQALIESPHLVTQAHQGFIDAGAELISVNSYACVPFHLGEALYKAKGYTLAEQAAVIAQEAANNAAHRVRVAGSLPPVFGSYRPDLFEKEGAFAVWTDLYYAQDKHVDLWLAETISSIAEVKVIADILQHSIKPCYYAFTLNDQIDSPATLRSGETVQQTIAFLLKEKVDGILFNCSIPEVIEQAIIEVNRQLQGHEKTLDIGAFANSFTPILTGHKANEVMQGCQDLSPEKYLSFVKKWHAQGANIIGGCCGIGLDHIQAISSWKRSI